MDFNINKCSMQYAVGRHNIGDRFILNGVVIGKSNSEKRLRSVGESEPEAKKAVY